MQISFGVATRIALLLGLVVGIAAKSQAAPVTVNVYTDNVLVQSFNSAALGCGPIAPGVEGCSAINNTVPANNFDTGDFNFRNITLQLSASAISLGSIAVDNQDTASHRLTVDIILSVPAIPGFTGVMGTLAGSITDGITGFDPGDDNAVLTTNGDGTSVYTALLDNIFYDSLHDDPAGAAVFTVGPTATSTTVPATNYGLPFPPGQLGPAVASSITLRYDFTLTPRDQAGLQGSLRVIPEPGTAALLVIGLFALAMAGRRR